VVSTLIRGVRPCLVTLLMLLSASASAFMPESGWWWNQSESGRGFNIEIQDNQLFLATFVYDASGNAIWYTAGGKMTNDRSFSGALVAYRSGQCLGCSYKAPQDGGSPGNISISFDAPNSATVVWPGGTTRISRFAFGVTWTAPSAIMGEWAIITGAPSYPVYYGERLKFNSFYTSGTTRYAAGNRSGQSGDYGVALAGLFDKNSSQWSAILDYNANYYTFYVINWDGVNTIRGKEWTYKKTEQLSGAGIDFVGFRMSGQTVAAGTAGPSIASASVGSPSASLDSVLGTLTASDLDKILAARSEASVSAAVASGEETPSNIEDIRLMANTLQQALTAQGRSKD